MPTPTTRRDPAWAILFLCVVPLLLGLLLTPFAYDLARWAGERFSLSHSISDPMFERVAGRCVQVVALLFLVPCFRWTGLWPGVRAGLRPARERTRDLVCGALFGIVSIWIAYAVGWLAGAYHVDPDLSWPSLAAGAALFVLAALMVGVFEEIFFRGFVFGALRERHGIWFAVIASSAIFSLMHFVRPRVPGDITDPSWYAGFHLLPHLFGKFTWVKDWDFMLMLFLMGVCLCGFYQRRGNLFFIAGLHAGWVWGMRVASDVLDRKVGYLDFWFSRGDLISKGALSVIVMASFAAWALLARRPSTPTPA